MRLLERKFPQVNFIVILSTGICFFTLCAYRNAFSQSNREDLLRNSTEDSFKALYKKNYHPVVEGTIEIDGSLIFIRTVRQFNKSCCSVLLLHAKGFDSGTWQLLGTLQILARAGYHAIAVDLPSFGRSPVLKHLKTPEEFFEILVPALHLYKPVIISPSMSNVYTLSYVFTHAKDISGFVAISPLISPAFTEKHFQHFNVPTLILHGKSDFRAIENNKLLTELPNGHIKIISNASKACYKDNPKQFHKFLIEFLNELK